MGEAGDAIMHVLFFQTKDWSCENVFVALVEARLKRPLTPAELIVAKGFYELFYKGD